MTNEEINNIIENYENTRELVDLIREMQEKANIYKVALQKAEIVLEGVMTIRREGDVLDVIHSALEA